MSALAEFERQLIVERTHAGLAAARAGGRSGGRPKTVTAEKIAVMRQMYAAREHTVERIAATVGVSRQTVYRYLNDDGSSGASADPTSPLQSFRSRDVIP